VPTQAIDIVEIDGIGESGELIFLFCR